MKSNIKNKSGAARYYAPDKGITRMRILIGNKPVISLCGDKSQYNALENDMVISKQRFIRIVLAMIVSDYHGFEKYVNSPELRMVLKPKTIIDMNKELQLLKANEVLIGGKYFNQYKKSLDAALKSPATIYMEIL